MKKIMAWCLTAVLIVSLLLVGTLSLSATSEERPVVNVYDATTLKTALATANAEVILWNDITMNYLQFSITVSCYSLDLNGYQVIVGSDYGSGQVDFSCAKFVLLDSTFSEDKDTENTGKITIKGRVFLNSTEWEIQSGKIEILEGIYGPEATLTILGGNVCVSTKTVHGKAGTNGADGRSFTDTAEYVNGAYGYKGTNGGNGDAGKSSYNAIEVSQLTVEGGYLQAHGGNGGNGGDGGNGGNGGKGQDSNYSGGNGGAGGRGGDGGKGGDGGHGIVATRVDIVDGVVSARGGDGGYGGGCGVGGAGGRAGLCHQPYSYHTPCNCKNGSAGSSGGAGSFGFDGYGACGILAETIVVHNGYVESSGGKAVENSWYTSLGKEEGPYGGSGICGNLTVYGGSVYAYGHGNSAGIGGAAYKKGQNLNGGNVDIRGGFVLAQGSNNAFDIGSGYFGSKNGQPGTLSVTGGTLELTTYGRATNVAAPIFKNCTVTGVGAYQHEGTYNADGKFTVSVQDVRIATEEYAGYDEVVLKATLGFSRTTNLTTPAPKGYILFKANGEEIQTASIANVIAADGVITAEATVNWTAVEGECRLTAEYVAGSGDKYAAGESYTYDCNIPAHTHDWDEEYTVDVEPTCTVPGSKSIHCGICDVQKDFTEVEATGHHYVNNQCDVCDEFLPLVIFKDYDGTVLSSEYYYLGDTVTIPTAPSREKDDTYTYAFVGWDKTVTVCDGDAVYTAVYEPTYREYTVVFKNYDGSELHRGTYHYGDLVAGPSAIPQKAADKRYTYTFAGWDNNLVPCNGDAVYTAVFTAEFINYTVTFKNDNGAILSRQSYHYGDTVQEPNAPTKAADATYTYAFIGWDKNVTIVTGDAVYTATYQSMYIDYTVTFKNTDGTILSQKTYHYGDAITAPNDPIKVPDNTYRYTFDGWDKPLGVCVGDATYTATYTRQYIEYTITFKDWDGSVLLTRSYYWGNTVYAPVTPIREADNTYTYTFTGWDKTIVKCAGNATYTATYARQYREYTVVFKNWDGTVLSSATYCWGDKVTAPSNPTKAADDTYMYVFAGWDKTVVNCAGNATYTATYTQREREYTVVFKDWNGNVLSSETYRKGEAVNVPASPSRAADNTYTYEFIGWDETVVNCNGDATYTAMYSRTFIDYTVVFKDWDGKVLLINTYHFGETVATPATPVKSADNTYTYTFIGWDKAVVNCNGNTTYTATYSRTFIDYTVVFKDWDGTVISTDTYHWSDAVEIPEVPLRAADNTYTYAFAGWDASVVNCVGDATYTATYKPTYIEYIVSFINDIGGIDGYLVISRKTYHWGDTVVVPSNPSREDDATHTYTFIGWDKPITTVVGDETYTAVYEANVKHNGWVQDAGKWYFYENGVMAKNAWRKDSIGWVYLGKDGAMLTNSWCTDSQGWCYVGADGYAVTNCWKKDSIGWIWLNANGSMTKNQWVLDGGKWYFLDANGYMVSNKWMKDSKGWVYLGSSGAMLTNAWCKDSVGWCYVGADGYAVTNCWKKDSVGWCYLNANGSMTKNGWVLDGNKWYYCDASGYMVANKTLTIGGKTYRFNASGVCLNP